MATGAKPIGGFTEAEVSVTMARGYELLARHAGANLARDLQKPIPVQGLPKPKYEAFPIAPLLLRDALPFDATYREMIRAAVPEKELSKVAEILLRRQLLYYATEGYYWRHMAGAPLTRRAFKDVVSAEMFSQIKEEVWGNDAPKGGEGYRGFYQILGMAQVDEAATAADEGLGYCARDLLRSAVFHFITELHVAPSEKFLKGGTLQELYIDGGRQPELRSGKPAQSLTDLASEPVDEEGKRLLDALANASFSEMCAMATKLLDQFKPRSKMEEQLIKLTKTSVSRLSTNRITVTGKEDGYDRIEKSEELGMLFDRTERVWNGEREGLLNSVSDTLREDTTPDQKTKERLAALLEDLKRHEQAH